MWGGVARGVGRRLLVAFACLTLVPSQGLSQTKTTYKYDALGRLTQVIDQDVDSGIVSRPVRYDYDDAGNRTRVSNGAAGQELVVSSFSASSLDSRHAGVSGLSPMKKMADLLTKSADTVIVTQSEAGGAWIQADLGPAPSGGHPPVDAIDLAPANVSAWGVNEAQLNGAEVAYSNDGSTWTLVGQVSGATLNAYKTVEVGSVSARYWRVRRPQASSGAVALGEFRLFSGKIAPSAPSENEHILHFNVVSGGAAQFNPFDLTHDGQDPRSVICCTRPAGSRVTFAEVRPQTPSLINYGVDNVGPGQGSFTFVMRDVAGNETTYTVMLDIDAAPDQPAGNLAPYTQVDRVKADVGVATTFYPLANDGDANGDTIRLTGIQPPGMQGEVVSWNGDSGAVTYTSNQLFTGNLTMTYYVQDRWGATSSGTVELSIIANNPPVANTDTIIARPGIAKTFDPRLNDTDPDGDRLSVYAVGTPQHGTAAVSLGQAIVYKAAAGYAGPDTFTYTLKDGRSFGTVTGTVNVTVQPNTDPKAVDDAYLVGVGGSTSFDPRANDSDVDDDVLKVGLVTTPANGVATVASDGRSVSYTPKPGFTGVDSFFYSVLDGYGGMGTAKITVTVDPNAVEYFVVGGGGGGGEGGGGGGGIRTGTISLSSGAHAITVGAGGVGAPVVGVWVPRDGWFISVPTGHGVAGDGQASSIDSLITALGGGGGGRPGASGGGGQGNPNSPTIGAGGAATAGQGHDGGRGGGGWLPLVVGNASGGGGGAGGPGGDGSPAKAGDGGPGVASDFSGVATEYAGGGGAGRGSEQAGPLAGAAGGTSAGAGGGTYVGEGIVSPGPTATAPNRGGGGGGGFIQKFPDRDAVGGDGGSGGSGVVMLRYTGPSRNLGGTVTHVGDYTLHTFTQSGALTIRANGAPTAANDIVHVLPGVTRAFDPRRNDSDPDGDTLYVVGVGGAAHGSVSIAPDARGLLYTPSTGATGDTFTYTVADGLGGTATASVTVVIQANAPPTANPDSQSGPGGTPLAFDPRANDTDPEGDELTVIAVSAPAHGDVALQPSGAGVVYTPRLEYIGPDSFTYVVADIYGNTATGTVSLAVTPAKVTWNPADRNASVGLSNGDLTMTANAADVAVRGTIGRSSGKLYFETRVDAASGGSNDIGVMTAAASLANGWWVGRDSYGYGYAGTGNILTANTSTPGAPTFGAGDMIGVAVDLTAGRIWWSKNGVWTGNPIAGTGGRAITAGTYFPAASGASGAVNTANFGASAFASAVPRGFAPWDLSAPPAANRAPVAANDNVVVLQGVAKAITPLANDTDVDQDTLSISAVGAPGHGALSGVGATSLTYTPAAGYLGPDSFTYTVSDGQGATATATVNINVRPELVTWSTTDKHGNISISGDGLVAQAISGNVWKGGRATKSRATGKLYFEATIGSGDLGVGLGNASANLANYIGADANGVFLYADPTYGRGVFIAGNSIGSWTSGTIAAGDVVQVAVDLDAKRLWAKRASDTTWNTSATASPATGTGGYDISGPAASALFPAVSIANVGPTVTGNFGASAFAAAPPRGFAPWDLAAPPAGNHAPVGVNDNVELPPGVASAIMPLTNDLDADLDALVVSAAGGAAHGTVTGVGGASLTYTPTNGYLGPDSFTYTLSDGQGGTATATVNILVVPPAPVTWSTTDKSANISISGGGLVAQAVAGGWKAGRATVARSGGKFYFEATIGSGDLGVGLGNASAGLGNYIGADANGVFLYADPTYGRGVFIAGGSVGNWTSGTIAAGDVVQVAVDLGAKRLWAKRVSDTTWNASATANPATGVGGYDISGPAASALFPAVSIQNAGPTVTGNFGASPFAAALPHGFASWDLSTPAAANHAPVAVNDNVDAQQGVGKVITPLSNDTDVDHDTLAISAVGSPAHGVLSGMGTTSVTYTASAGYVGPDSFTYTVSDGQGGIATGTVNITVRPTPVTWSTTDKHGNISISGGGLVAQAVAGGWKAGRANQSRSSGKFYFEATIGSGDLGVGLGNASAGLGNYIGADANGVFLYADPSWGRGVFIAGGSPGNWTSGTIVAGDVVQVAVDLNAKRLWAKRVSDTTWNASATANPATGVGGYDISGPAASALFPAVSIQSVGPTVTGNFGASAFAGTRPSGYLSWDGS